MATVIVDDNIARILTADALSSGLKVGDVLNMDQVVAAFVQEQFGTNSKIQSVTYEELSVLTNLEDGTIVYVSNIPPNKGSYWRKRISTWLPVNGFLNYFINNTVIQHPHSDPTYEVCNIPVNGGVVKNGVLGNFLISVARNSFDLSDTFGVNINIYGKNYQTGNDTVSSISVGEIAINEQRLLIESLIYSLPANNVNRMFVNAELTDINTNQDWVIKVEPVTPPVEGEVFASYLSALSFSFY